MATQSSEADKAYCSVVSRPSAGEKFSAAGSSVDAARNNDDKLPGVLSVRVPPSPKLLSPAGISSLEDSAASTPEAAIPSSLPVTRPCPSSDGSEPLAMRGSALSSPETTSGILAEPASSTTGERCVLS